MSDRGIFLPLVAVALIVLAPSCVKEPADKVQETDHRRENIAQRQLARDARDEADRAKKAVAELEKRVQELEGKLAQAEQSQTEALRTELEKLRKELGELKKPGQQKPPVSADEAKAIVARVDAAIKNGHGKSGLAERLKIALDVDELDEPKVDALKAEVDGLKAELERCPEGTERKAELVGKLEKMTSAIGTAKELKAEKEKVKAQSSELKAACENVDGAENVYREGAKAEIKGLDVSSYKDDNDKAVAEKLKQLAEKLEGVNISQTSKKDDVLALEKVIGELKVLRDEVKQVEPKAPKFEGKPIVQKTLAYVDKLEVALTKAKELDAAETKGKVKELRGELGKLMSSLKDMAVGL